MRVCDRRYPHLLRARVPRAISEAVEAAARAKYVTRSEYLRQALLKSLIADGACLAPIQSKPGTPMAP
jgi:hypothetical protein